MNQQIEDRELVEKLMTKVLKLQHKCDAIGNDEIRRKIDEHLREVWLLLNDGFSSNRTHLDDYLSEAFGVRVGCVIFESCQPNELLTKVIFPSEELLTAVGAAGLISNTLHFKTSEPIHKTEHGKIKVTSCKFVCGFYEYTALCCYGKETEEVIERLIP